MEVKGSLNSRMFLRQTMESTRHSFEVGLVEEAFEEKFKKVAIDRDVTLFDVKVGYKLMAGSDKLRYLSNESRYISKMGRISWHKWISIVTALATYYINESTLGPST